LHARQSGSALRQRLPDRSELGSIGLRDRGVLVLEEHFDEVDLEFVFTDLEDLKSALSILVQGSTTHGEKYGLPVVLLKQYGTRRRLEVEVT